MINEELLVCHHFVEGSNIRRLRNVENGRRFGLNFEIGQERVIID